MTRDTRNPVSVRIGPASPLPDLEATRLNDVWGREDSETGMQVAIAGSFEGTAFVDVTDGANPVYLGTLDSPLPGNSRNLWGDIRVYEDHAYIGSEAAAVVDGAVVGFGVQIVDLTQFRGATEAVEVAGCLDDELSGAVDERTTHLWHMADLDDAQVIGVRSDGNSSIDHNVFVDDNLLYQANYSSGPWIYDTWKVEQGRMEDRGYFDVFPADDVTEFFGAWGTYPFFGDGKVVVTSSDEGLVVLESRVKSSANNNCGGSKR